MSASSATSNISSTGSSVTTVSKNALWSGRVISMLLVPFLAFDSVMKFVKPAAVVVATAHLGWSMDLSATLGAVLLISVILYTVPSTSILGAILLTGYLGGAVATHLRVGDPLFSHVLFPVYFGVLLWLALYLREARLRVLIPLRTSMQ